MKAIFLICLLLPCTLFAQKSPARAAQKIGANPIMIVDSNRITKSEFQKLNPDTIAVLNILHDTTAFKLYGSEAKDGVIIITTKSLARKLYTSFFRKVSPKYDSLYNITKSDSTFQYIINNKVKKQSDEGDLSVITDELFISLDILTADDLKRDYNIIDKPIGILIKSRRPEDLYHARKKF